MANVYDIALVFSPHEWVEALHRHCTNTGDLRIRALVYDSSVLETEIFDACIIADSHPALSSGFVLSLHEAGHAVLGICDKSAEAQSFLASTGIDAIFSSKISAEQLTGEIREFLNNTWNKPQDVIDIPHINATQEDVRKPNNIGHVVSVVGAGGTGTTEVALVLASRLIDSVAVDLDFEHPSFAPRAGLALEPHLLGAIESAHNHPETFPDFVQRMPSNGVISGTSHASFTRDIRSYELESLHHRLISTYAHTIYDLGRISEDSHFFSRTQTLLNVTDPVLIVIEPNPVGILRGLEIIALVSSLQHSETNEKRIGVIVNKCPKNKDMLKDVSRELEAIEQISMIALLPFASELLGRSWCNEVIQPRSWKAPINHILDFICTDRMPSDSTSKKRDRVDLTLEPVGAST